MIKLEVDSVYILDLKDDIVMNFTNDLYQFIDEDPVRAFHVGMNINEWFEELEPRQQYLYSKQLRHNKDFLDKYIDQMNFWITRFSNDKEIGLLHLSEYILNNMFWDEDTEKLDRVRMALFLGQGVRSQMDKQNGEALE